jgi:hypothetical protein
MFHKIDFGVLKFKIPLLKPKLNLLNKFLFLKKIQHMIFGSFDYDCTLLSPFRYSFAMEHNSWAIF